MPTDLRARELPGWVDPAELYLSGPAAAEYSFWLDAGPDATDGWSWVGAGRPAEEAPREQECAASPRDDAAGPFSGGWVGWMDYDAASHSALSAALPGAARTGRVRADRGLWADRFVALDHRARRAWAWAPADDLDAFAAEVATWRGARDEPAAATPVDIAARHTPDAYAALIERCREAIREGDAYQLCLTTRFETTASVDPVAAFLRLRRATPAHHGALIRVGDHALASASPERFLEVADGVVRTRPIKGTRPRGANASSDEALARELADSVKERAENVMIVDLMRNDLQRVCLPGSVAVERLLEVESYAAVHQLVSTVAGRLRPGTRVGDVLEAAFPAGSMTGAPKLSAMTILRRLEGGPRGAFAGCFGWIGADGRADLAMVIRSVVFHPDGAYVGAGGGITWRSDAAAEVAEVGVKARGPLSALGGALPPGW
ncbi:aminodeoxychorismate synthase component I [Microbacterium sp. PA5]|uniref:aminodeoxychorismate synthase component I n=1 Tax=Microbacterium sp. PA5 TaxID=3416654 RepID=UPI003CEE9231